MFKHFQIGMLTWNRCGDYYLLLSRSSYIVHYNNIGFFIRDNNHINFSQELINQFNILILYV